MYNGGISNFQPLLVMKSMMLVAQILQSLSYVVFSSLSLKFVAFGWVILVYGISAIMHHQPVAILRGHSGFLYKLAKWNGRERMPRKKGGDFMSTTGFKPVKIYIRKTVDPLLQIHQEVQADILFRHLKQNEIRPVTVYFQTSDRETIIITSKSYHWTAR